MKKKTKLTICPICGHDVFSNWRVRHAQSKCTLGTYKKNFEDSRKLARHVLATVFAWSTQVSETHNTEETPLLDDLELLFADYGQSLLARAQTRLRAMCPKGEMGALYFTKAANALEPLKKALS